MSVCLKTFIWILLGQGLAFLVNTGWQPCHTLSRWTLCLVWNSRICSFRQWARLCVWRFQEVPASEGITSSSSSIYHPPGNGQTEKTVGAVWKAVQLALKNHDLPLSHWEVVLEDVLHSVRSLLCTATNTTPHERFFNFQCRSGSCESLPSWQTDGRKVLNDLLGRRGGARHFHLGGHWRGQFCNKGSCQWSV